jgi:hypothetical protein
VNENLSSNIKQESSNPYLSLHNSTEQAKGCSPSSHPLPSMPGKGQSPALSVPYMVPRGLAFSPNARASANQPQVLPSPLAVRPMSSQGQSQAMTTLLGRLEAGTTSVPQGTSNFTSSPQETHVGQPTDPGVSITPGSLATHMSHLPNSSSAVSRAFAPTAPPVSCGAAAKGKAEAIPYSATKYPSFSSAPRGSLISNQMAMQTRMCPIRFVPPLSHSQSGNMALGASPDSLERAENNTELSSTSALTKSNLQQLSASNNDQGQLSPYSVRAVMSFDQSRARAHEHDTGSVLNPSSGGVVLPQRPAEPGVGAEGNDMTAKYTSLLRVAPSQPKAMRPMTATDVRMTMNARVNKPTKTTLPKLTEVDLQKGPCRRCRFVHKGGDCEKSCIGCGSIHHDRHEVVCAFRDRRPNKAQNRFPFLKKESDYFGMRASSGVADLKDSSNHSSLDRNSTASKLSLECQKRGFNPNFKYYEDPVLDKYKADLYINGKFISGEGISYRSQKEARDALAQKGLDLLLDVDAGRERTYSTPIPALKSEGGLSKIPSASSQPSNAVSKTGRRSDARETTRPYQDAMDVDIPPVGAQKVCPKRRCLIITQTHAG